MFNGFDTNSDPNGPAHVAAITQGYKDMATQVNAVLQGDQQIYNAVIKNYFHPSHFSVVSKILNNLVLPAGGDVGTGSSLIGSVTMNGSDIRNKCVDPQIFAYTGSQRDGSASQIHLCAERGYGYPSLAQVSCDVLDPEVSWKMTTLGGSVILHELTWVSLYLPI